MTFPPKHVVVPVDTDAASDGALADHLVDSAVELALALGARLTLVHVALAAMQPPILPPDATGEIYRTMVDVLETRNANASKGLMRQQERARARGVGAEVVLVRRAGSVPELLVDTARELGGDLIMMATHGRKGLQRLVLGSVAERTAHLSPLPVLLLPAHA